MPWTTTFLQTETAKREIDLLSQGFGYRDIAAMTGVRAATLQERNRLLYRIDLHRAFRERIGREGIPYQLCVNDDFGYYFAGLFDGEGSIVAWHRTDRRNKPYPEFRLALQITLRDDDTDVLKYVQQHIGGAIHWQRRDGKTNPSVHWRLESIKQLTENIIPLFDKYPLHSKKGREYQIWRPLLIERYIATLGGTRHSGDATVDRESGYEARFIEAVAAIKAIRTYSHRL